MFRETPRCRSCGHTWQSYVHGFSRGHSVLIRGERIGFIPDDLSYAFVEAIDRAAHTNPIHRLGDFADPLRRLGWRDLESCPACGARNISARYNQTTIEEVPAPSLLGEQGGLVLLADRRHSRLAMALFSMINPMLRKERGWF